MSDIDIAPINQDDVWNIHDALAGRCSTRQLGQSRKTEAASPQTTPISNAPTLEQVVLDIETAYQRKGGYAFLMSRPALMRRALAMTVKQIKVQAEPAAIIEFRPHRA